MPTPTAAVKVNPTTGALIVPSAATFASANGFLTSGSSDAKASVRVATTANGTLATAFENGDTVDGIVLATSDRILIKNQSAPAENGIYTVNASGAPTRATDFDAWTEIPGAFVSVEAGTVNAGTQWLCNVVAGGTLGVTAITFVVPKNYVDLTTGQTIAGQKVFTDPLASFSGISFQNGFGAAAVDGVLFFSEDQTQLGIIGGSPAEYLWLRFSGNTDVTLPSSGTLLSTASSAGSFPTLNQSTTGSAATLTTGRTLAITGDLAWTSPSFDGGGNVTAAGTLATVNSNVGSFGSATQASVITVNAKGLVTAASNTTVTPAVGSITGLGTGVATALAVANNSAGGYSTIDGTATLSNKTLTAPRIASGGFIADANGNEQIIFTTTASAVNELTYANAATGNAPTFQASGGDTNIGVGYKTKGTGTHVFSVNGLATVTIGPGYIYAQQTGGYVNFNTSSQLLGGSWQIGAGNGTTTIDGATVFTTQSLYGAGAINLTTTTTAYTSTGAAQALTLANGTAGQIKTICHVVDGGSGVLTPTTKSGYTTITFTNAGDSVTLQYHTTAGWCIVGSYGVTIA